MFKEGGYKLGYADEKILDFLNGAEKELIQQNICDGPVKVGKKSYEFKENLFFDEKLSIYIPEEFVDMSENMKNTKYPSNQRPEIIKTDEAGSTNIMLNRIDNELDEDQVEDLKDGMKALLKKMNPSNVFFTDGVEPVDEKNIGYFEFKSPAMDVAIYNLMFFFEFKGKTVMGTFCCIYDEYKSWRDIAFQVMKTVRVLKDV